jgi:flagellar transcriptional activator FlhD
MNADQILIEIRETNLSYLTLAQSLILADREQAMHSLGLSEAAANRLATLTPDQILKVASANTLVCRMRMDDDLVWGLLTNHGKGTGSEGYARLQAAYAAATRNPEAA